MVRAQHAKRCEAQGGAEPTVDDLQSISLKGRFNARSDAWSAAIAAGRRWAVRYWAELSRYIPGRSRETDLADGHFHGGNAALDDLRLSQARVTRSSRERRAFDIRNPAKPAADGKAERLRPRAGAAAKKRRRTRPKPGRLRSVVSERLLHAERHRLIA